MRTLLYKVCAAAVLLLLAMALGCKPRPTISRAVVEVKADEDLVAEKTASVDIIGVRELERFPWDKKPVDSYWTPGDRDRAKADPKEMRNFDRDNPQTLEEDDEIWVTWEEEGLRYLFVIADIPGVDIDKDRKLDYDLKEVRGKKIQIRVTAKGLVRVE